MTVSAITACALGVGLGSAVIAAQPPPVLPPASAAPTSSALPTADFLIAIAQSDEFERRESRLALSRSSNPHVRHAAMMTLQAHADSMSTMSLAAARQRLAAPAPSLTAEQQQMLARLQDAPAVDFDRIYVHHQLKVHQQTMAMVTAYAENGEPGPVRSASLEVAPVVQQHLSLFQTLRDLSR